MELMLSCYYDIRFTMLVCSFVSEAARSLGASEREAQELSLAAEEATGHIIENHPEAGIDDRFEVICSVRDEGLELTFKNTGLPVDARALPRYDLERVEDTIDGLRFHLIEKLVDHHEFVNLGRLGWRTVLFKRIGNLERPLFGPEGEGEDLVARAAEKLVVRRAVPEDAPAIVELAYRNYSYSYAKETFYFADRLGEELRSEKVFSIVALNPAGTMVGQVAILASEECPEVAEVGALMVLPEYRRSLGLLQMIKLAQRFAVGESSPFRLFESNFVTAHTISQKAGMLFRFKPMALKLSVHERASYKGMEGVSAQRESHLYSVVGRTELPSLELYVPRVHASFTEALFRRICAAPTCLDGEAPVPADSPETELAVHLKPDYSLATVTVERAGPDLLPRLRRCLHDLGMDDLKTVYVEFPAWKPSLCGVEEHSAELQIFFSGFVARTPDRWHVLYTQLNRQRFDFQEVQLAEPAALDLRSYVEFCRKRIEPR